MSKARYQDGSTQTYEYQDEQCETCLTKIINAAGEVEQQINYDEQGRVISSEGANGSNLRNFIYGDGEVIVSDSAEAQTHYEFNLHHGVLKIAKLTDAMGQSETFGYDNNGYPSNHTAKNGNITETEYNERGLLEVTVENAGTDAERETNTQWHADFRKPTERSEINQITAFDYDNSGRLTQQVQSPNSEGVDDETLEDRVTAFAYNELGQIIETVSPNGASRTQIYDDQGNRTSATNALGHQTQTLTFDEAGRPLKSQDSNGIITENQYDSSGRLLKSIINEQTTSYEYDSVGRQTKVTYSDGTYSENQYDSSGRVIKTVNQRGEVTENSYDSNGNRTKRHLNDAQGNLLAKTETRYNSLNQVVQTLDAEENVTSFEYDASGNQIKITDAKGNTTQNQYDSQNRLTKTIDALGGETIYQYDINDNQIQVTAANGATTTFSYDSLNQLISENSPDRGETVYDYDISGNRILIMDANSNIKNTVYDDLNRKTQESWTDHPELTIDYSYDNCTHGIGRLCQGNDASGHTRYEYNSDGQVTQKDQNIQGIILTQQFSYTADKKLQSQTYPSGTVIGYSYNEDQINKITINQETFIQNIHYDAANRITGWQWEDNSEYNKSYDQNGRLKTFTLGDSQRTLEYDETNNIIGWTDENSDEYKQFGYDALNRLNDYNKNLAIADEALDDEILQSQSFNYDANGNRTQLIEDGTTSTSYQILENSNRLIAIDNNTQEYDSNGNLINDGEHTYQYDARNRLTSVDGITDNLYNSDNQRVKKANTNETTLYAWTNERIFGEYDEQGNSMQETIYLGNTPVGIIKQEETYRIYADQIGTPRVITDENNLTVWKWKSKPFGESLPKEDPDADNINFSYNLRFPGQYYDGESRTHYNFFRNYSPHVGRYVQSDPIGVNGGINTYGYVASNPLIGSDPKGEVWAILRYIFESLPVISFSKTTHPHVTFTITLGFSKGKPTNLTRCSACIAANRSASIGSLGSASVAVGMPGWSWDEYPFASTKEGGAGAVVNPVPSVENSSQGGLLSAFYKANNIVDGGRFIVAVIP